MMTPFDYAQLYWTLPVAIVNGAGELTGWDYARVDRYRLAVRQATEQETYDADTTAFLNEFETRIQPFADKNVKEVTVYTRNADGAVRTQTFTRAEHWKLMRLAKRGIWGKGTPEECQITLQLVLRYGLASSIQELRRYCEDGKIGLDCNGFVGAYMRDVLGKNVDGETLVSALVKAGAPVKTMDEINHLNIYILGFVDASGTVIAQRSGDKWAHIMITMPYQFEQIGVRGGGAYKRLEVVESTGGKGLVRSDYLFLEAEKAGGKETGVFKVHRGSKDEEMRVRLARVWV